VIGRKAQIGKLSMGSSPSEIIAKLATAPEVKVPREPIGAAVIRGNVRLDKMLEENVRDV
jgi:hypothetical protein